MARLDYTDDGGDVADRIRLRRGGRLNALDRMLLHSPPVADGWNTFLGTIRTRCTLPGDIRELAILRIAAINGAEFEWTAHEPLGRDEGLTDADLDVLRTGTGQLDGARGAALAYTEAMTLHVTVPDDVFDALRAHFDDRHVVELTATIGAYNLVSRFLVALEVGQEETGATEM